MPLSAKGAIVTSAIAAALLLFGAWMLRNEREHSRDSTTENMVREEQVNITRARLPANRRPGSTAIGNNPYTSSAAEMTSGVRMISALAPPLEVLPSLTGYLIDSFENWTTIPESYSVDGLMLRNGAIVLSDIAGTTAPRFGQMVSPPLPLRSPALAAPISVRRELPPDASISLEISLNEDGTGWSPWVAVEKYAPPDGKRVTPPLQPTISESDLAKYDGSTSTAATAGPSVRYRLSLSASSSASPAIADIRIWKREHF